MAGLRTTFDNPASAPAPAGNYSHIARVELGDGALLVVSGQIALSEDGELIGRGSMADQSERVFEILGAILAAHAAGFEDVINIRTYVTDMSRIGEYRAVRRRHLTGEPPTSTTIEVSRLVVPEALVEVDLIAARGLLPPQLAASVDASQSSEAIPIAGDESVCALGRPRQGPEQARERRSSGQQLRERGCGSAGREQLARRKREVP
jgi:enamine deaminase RidA (YjgF/YER057c/UK114 family)